MRIRIIIDTQDDDGGDKPFTLTAHRDDDGTQARDSLDVGPGSVVGGSIPRMLRETADAWEKGDVTGWDGPVPGTVEEWRSESTSTEL